MGLSGRAPRSAAVGTHQRGRRQFLRGSAAFAGLTLLRHREAAGQQTARIPRIGFLAVGSREGRAFLIEGFRSGLRERGYMEGKNIVIEYRFSEERNDRLPALAAELVALKVSLIVASGTPASFAARDATTTIPIVMGGIAADPVATGLVVSLARPGRNITGMSMMSADLGGKRLELLKRMLPDLARIAVFWNPPNPAYGPILKELEAAARTLRLEVQRLEVRVPEDFAAAFEAAARQEAGALIAPGDPLVTNRPKMVADLALKYRMPTMLETRQFVEAGGLLSLGLDLVDSYRRAATHVDKILKGANPAELPMEQPTKFDLAVNLRTARLLGLAIPQSVLLQATRVIE
jgi:putative ABC transport system substrate-binding protein